ncbi:hypothetical protein T492DRAFT_915240, partial [Pavlovales sp. CCMP2436]
PAAEPATESASVAAAAIAATTKPTAKPTANPPPLPAIDAALSLKRDSSAVLFGVQADASVRRLSGHLQFTSQSGDVVICPANGRSVTIVGQATIVAITLGDRVVSPWNNPYHGLHGVKLDGGKKDSSKNLNAAAARQAREDAPTSSPCAPAVVQVAHGQEKPGISARRLPTLLCLAAALPSGTSAFSLKQNGEPRKNERAAVAGGDDEDGDGDKDEEGG